MAEKIFLMKLSINPFLKLIRIGFLLMFFYVLETSNSYSQVKDTWGLIDFTNSDSLLLTEDGSLLLKKGINFLKENKDTFFINHEFVITTFFCDSLYKNNPELAYRMCSMIIDNMLEEIGRKYASSFLISYQPFITSPNNCIYRGVQLKVRKKTKD